MTEAVDPVILALSRDIAEYQAQLDELNGRRPFILDGGQKTVKQLLDDGLRGVSVAATMGAITARQRRRIP